MTTSQRPSSTRAYRLFVVVALLLGATAGVFGQPLIHGNAEAAGIIVTVFSILAGFLIAVMTLLGDQSILPGSWRLATDQREGLRAKLIRQKWLFYVYLTTLLLIFATSLVRAEHAEAAKWLEHIYLGSSTFAFILSFRLPSTLMEVQTDRIEAVIGARRSKASVLDRN